MERTPKSIRRVRFGEFEVDLLERHLHRRGLKMKIHERPFQVLSVLLARPGEVVRREEFQQTIWPSDTNVEFNANLNTALTTLRRALGDSPRNAVFIKTIPRQGYRFIAPVMPIEDDFQSAQFVPPLPTTPAKEAAARTEQSAPMQRFILIFSLLLLVGGLAGWHVYAGRSGRSTKTTVPAHTVAILILPFDHLGDDSDRDVLTEGLAYEIITGLGQRFPEHLDAMAAAAAMQRKDAKMSLDEIAREENVSYVLEGTYLCRGERIHITAQLYGARERATLWTDSYDRDAKDLVAAQSDIASQIVKSLSPKLLR